MTQVNDARILSNVASLTGCLAKVVASNPVSFDGGVGFVCQQFESVFPEYVNNTDNGTDPPTGQPLWSITDYWEFDSPFIFGAIKELNATLNAAGGDVSAVQSSISALGTVYSATLSDTAAAASGTAKTVGTLSIPSPGKYLVYAKASLVSQGLTLTMTATDVSISQTTNAHEAKSRTRETFASLLGTARNIAPNGYFVDVASSKTLYLVLSAAYTGTAPQTVAADSEFYAVKIGNH